MQGDRLLPSVQRFGRLSARRHVTVECLVFEVIPKLNIMEGSRGGAGVGRGQQNSKDSRRVPEQPQRPDLVPLVNSGWIDRPAGGRVSTGKGREEG